MSMIDNLGLMPYRRQIVAVSEYLCCFMLFRLGDGCQVGQPIHVTQTENPNQEEVMMVQKQYIDELERYV